MTTEWSISQVPLFPMQTASADRLPLPDSPREVPEAGETLLMLNADHQAGPSARTCAGSGGLTKGRMNRLPLMGVYSGDHEWSFHQCCSPRFLLCYIMGIWECPGRSH